MSWKIANVQLKKGYIFPVYGGSAPIFRRICEETDLR